MSGSHGETKDIRNDDEENEWLDILDADCEGDVLGLATGAEGMVLHQKSRNQRNIIKSMSFMYMNAEEGSCKKKGISDLIMALPGRIVFLTLVMQGTEMMSVLPCIHSGV